jgi:uncharacterized heparinase superfamily protein
MGRITRPKAHLMMQHFGQMFRRTLRSVSFSSPVYAMKLRGPHPLRLLATPKDLWAGDRVAGVQLLAGGFIGKGQMLMPFGVQKSANAHPWKAEDLWRAQDLSEGWKAWLHGFSWLRDLQTVSDHATARQRAEGLLKEWLKQFDKWDPLAWRSDILARRLMSWMTYAPLILSTSDHVYRSLVLNSMARQSRHLARSIEDAPLGLPQLVASIGLIYSGLFLPNAPQRLKRGIVSLERQLHLLILADGGIITRNPADLYDALRDLQGLREALEQMHQDVPEKLQDAIDRMGPMLRSFCHGDGQLALFNGSYEMKAADIKELLTRIGSAGEFFDNAVYMGFQRIARGQTMVIADIGPPAPLPYSYNGHAGTLSFELSDGADRMVVNCGSASSLPEGRPDAFLHLKAASFNALAQATAAHSTLVVDDTNSSEILENGFIGNGPTVVEYDRHDENGGTWLEASHNGYEPRFGLVHKRRFYLDPEGADLRGEDILVRTGKLNRADHFDVRFQLHPKVSAILDEAGEGVTLTLPSGRRWYFLAKGGRMTLDESIYLGKPHNAVKTRHISLSGEAGEGETLINWSFRRLGENETS